MITVNPYLVILVSLLGQAGFLYLAHRLILDQVRQRLAIFLTQFQADSNVKEKVAFEAGLSEARLAAGAAREAALAAATAAVAVAEAARLAAATVAEAVAAAARLERVAHRAVESKEPAAS